MWISEQLSGNAKKYLGVLLRLSWAPRIQGNIDFRTAQVTVSFHNFKLQNLKLSVSNPKSKYVAYLSVLSQISNCQGLGRKNKHEILKTDRRVPSNFPEVQRSRPTAATQCDDLPERVLTIIPLFPEDLPETTPNYYT